MASEPNPFAQFVKPAAPDAANPFAQFVKPPAAVAQADPPAKSATPSTSFSGVTGAVTRGVAPYAAAAGLGGMVGGPVGAGVGVGAAAASDITAALYNPLAEHLGWPKMATPKEMTDKVLDYFGVKKPSTGVERMVETTAGGVAGGGAMAKAAGAVAPLAGGVTKQVLGRLAEQPALQAVAGGTGGASAQGAAEAGLPPWAQTLAGLGGGAVVLPFTGTRLTPAQKATGLVEKRLAEGVKAGETTPQEIVDRLAQGRALGKPLTLADVGGTNVKGLAGAVARAPGESKAVMDAALKDRDAGAGARTQADVARDLGLGPSARRTVQGLRQLQSVEGNPLYEKAFEGGSIAPLERQFEVAFDAASKAEAAAAADITKAQGQLTAAQARQTQAGNVYSASAANTYVTEAQSVLNKAQRALAGAQSDKAEVLAKLREAQGDASAGKPGAVWNPRIQQFISDPTVRSGMKRGLEIQRLEALAKGEKFDPTEYAITGTDAAGEPIVSKVPNMRLLNAAKKGLDAIIESERKDGMLTERGRAADMARKALLEELDAVNPDYKTARAKWAGEAATIDATNLGKSIAKLSPEQVADAVAGMTAGDREFFRLGVADNLLERVLKTAENGDEARKLINSEWSRLQLKPVFATQAALENFLRSVAEERAMFETKNAVLGGSQTAGRGAEDTLHAGVSAAHGAGQLFSGNPLAAAMSAWKTARLLGGRPSPERDAAVARLLTDPQVTPTIGPKGMTISPTGQTAKEMQPRGMVPFSALMPRQTQQAPAAAPWSPPQ